MKLFRNKKFNFIVSIVFGLIISITINVFAATVSPLSNYSGSQSGDSGQPDGSIGGVRWYLAGVLNPWTTSVTQQVNANTGYFTTLFGSSGPTSNTTIQNYIDTEISNALATPAAGPSATPSAAYAAVQDTVNYFINQAFSNSASPAYTTFQTAINSLAGTAITNALAPASTGTPAGSIMAAINTATNNFASVSSVANALSSGSTTMPSAVDSYIQTELGSSASNQTIQNAVNSFLTSTTGLTITSGKTPTSGSLKQYINHVISNALKTKIPKGGSPNALQSAVNSLANSAVASALAPVSKSLPTGGSITQAINTAVTPLQNNFATLFGTDKNGKANIPTQTLGNYIRAGTTITIAHALNTQNPKSNSPAQQLQSAVTSVVTPTITQAINTAISPLQTGVKTLNTKFSTWFRANDALTRKFQSAMNKYLANALSAPNPAAASSEHTLQFTVDSRVNNIIFSGLQTGGTIHSAINTNSLSHITNSLNTPIPTGGSPNALQAAVNSLASTAAGTVITTALAPATSKTTGGLIIQAINTAVNQLPTDINTSGTAINKAMNQFIQFYLSPTNSTFQSAVNSLISSNPTVSTLNTNFTTIFGSSTPTGNLQSYLNNGVAFALSNDSKGAPNSGNAQSAVQSVVASALGGSGTDVKSAVSSSVASALEAGSTSITTAVQKYIQENFLTPPSSGATPSASWTALQSAVQTANQNANGVWYVNNVNNLQTTLTSAGNAAQSSGNPQTVRLAAGNYSIGDTLLKIPSNVTLEGVGGLATQLTVVSGTDAYMYPVQMEPGSGLSNLSLFNMSLYDMTIALDCNSSSSTVPSACTFTLSHMLIQENDYLIDIINDSSSVPVNINIDSSYLKVANFIYIDTTSSQSLTPTLNAVNNYLNSIPPASTNETTLGCGFFGSVIVASKNIAGSITFGWKENNRLKALVGSYPTACD